MSRKAPVYRWNFTPGFEEGLEPSTHHTQRMLLPWATILFILTVHHICLHTVAQSTEPLTLISPGEVLACESTTLWWIGGQPLYSLFYAVAASGLQQEENIGNDVLIAKTEMTNLTFVAPNKPGKMLRFKVVDGLGEESTLWILDQPSSSCSDSTITIIHPPQTSATQTMITQPRTTPDPETTLTSPTLHDSFSLPEETTPIVTPTLTRQESGTATQTRPPEDGGSVIPSNTAVGTNAPSLTSVGNTVISAGGENHGPNAPNTDDTGSGPATAAPYRDSSKSDQARHPISKQAKGAIFGTIFGSMFIFLGVVCWRWRVKQLEKRKPIAVLPRSRKEGEDISGRGDSSEFAERGSLSNSNKSGPIRRIGAGINEEELRSMMLLHTPVSPVTPTSMSPQARAPSSASQHPSQSTLPHVVISSTQQTNPVEIDPVSPVSLTLPSPTPPTYPRVPPLLIPSSKERGSRVNLNRSSPSQMTIGGTIEQHPTPHDSATRMTTPSMVSQSTVDREIEGRRLSDHRNRDSIEPEDSQYDNRNTRPEADDISLYLRPSPTYDNPRHEIPSVSLQQLVGRELENLLTQMTIPPTPQGPSTPPSLQHQGDPSSHDLASPAYEPHSQPRLTLHIPPPPLRSAPSREKEPIQRIEETASSSRGAVSAANDEQDSSRSPSYPPPSHGSPTSSMPAHEMPGSHSRTAHSPRSVSTSVHTQRLVISRQDMEHLADLVALRISGPDTQRIDRRGNRIGSGNVNPLVRGDAGDNLPPPSYT
ncbi:hypothetical protein FRC14_005406 [Serendipita sp. 396]|nr:hypothetical protein FRC14_005406 [Serendipita sp. 396]